MSKLDALVTEWRAMGPAIWAEHPYGWIMPNGEPITLADWQRAVLGAWWEHRGTTTTLGISNVKKTGKTTTNAILLCWRWLTLPSEHLAAANDLDQSQGRQFKMIADMVKRHPLLSKRVKVLAKKLTFAPTGSTLEALERDAAGRSGSNHSTASHTECWGVVHEANVRCYEELTPPPDRRFGFPALRICDSYAGHIAESDTWHDLVDRGLAGERLPGDWPVHKANGLLLFHMQGQEAQERCFRGTPEERAAYYSDQRASLRANTYARLHLNARSKSESLFVSPQVWDSLFTGILPLPAGSPHEVFAGVDLAYSPTGDNCAVAGIYVTRGKVRVAFAKVWKSGERTEDLQIANVETLLLYVASRCNLKNLALDPFQSVYLSQRLADAGLPVSLCPQSHKSRGPSDTLLWRLCRDGNLELPELPELREAGRASAESIGDGGMIFIKKWRAAKCDVLIALSLALFARAQPRFEYEVVKLPWVKIGAY